MKCPLALGALVLCAPLSSGLLPANAVGSGEEIPWNERTVEHLLNRAGFGGDGVTIRTMAARKPEEVVDWLLEARAEREKFEPECVLYLDEAKGAELGWSKEKIVEMQAVLKTKDNTQFRKYLEGWYGSMLEGGQPLADRMTIFWHGFFPTSGDVVRRKYELIRQHQFLADNSLGNFETLVRGIAHDPAMCWFLDNDSNVKGHPNENLGRELLELFSLGEGNYTEVDVREAARALTGVASDRDTGHSVFNAENHDEGKKKVLGVEGELDSNKLVDIILEQDACPRWVCKKIITYMEGVEPDAERLQEYAEYLKEQEYELKPLLRKLLLDPRFYREEVVGARVQSPTDYVVGSLRRMGVQPPNMFVFYASKSLGQEPYRPPSVEGWKEGETWITNDSLMHRGNVTGVLLGVFGKEFGGMESEGMMAEDAGEAVAQRAMSAQALVLHAELIKERWEPTTPLVERLRGAQATSDEEVADFLLGELLAIEPFPETRALIIDYLQVLRAEHQIEGPILGSDADLGLVIRRLAHMILSLPEAQLG